MFNFLCKDENSFFFSMLTNYCDHDGQETTQMTRVKVDATDEWESLFFHLNSEGD